MMLMMMTAATVKALVAMTWTNRSLELLQEFGQFEWQDGKDLLLPVHSSVGQHTHLMWLLMLSNLNVSLRYSFRMIC